ncbi:CDT1 Geminin-binding domain-like-containing protein [Aphelenchoides bicaudatus]|nr:CDT1 Geminin-binding domain-like-containing protein [Aphelenchoides bicaudatus]
MDSKVLKTSKLRLPTKFERLYELFNEMEQVCMAMFTRKQQITLDAVRRVVAKNAPKYLPSLTSEVLAKIVHVYPKAYTIKLTQKAGKSGEPVKHQYVLVPNLRDDLSPYYTKPVETPSKGQLKFESSLVMPSPPVSPQKVRQFGASDYVARSPKKSPIKPVMRCARLDFGPKFEPWRQKCRSSIFKFMLFEFLKEKHQEYLDEIDVEFEEAGANLFHPEFLMNHLPEIPRAKLPVAEKSAIQKTMKDYVLSVQDPILNSIEKVTQRLKSPVKIKKEIKEEEATVPVKAEVKTPMKSKMNLLERIREKERAKKEAESARDIVTEKRLSQLEELKIRALGIIYSEYKQRTSMELTALYQRLKFSIIGLRQEDFNGIVDILAEVATGHFELDTVSSNNRRYLKMLNKDVAQITQIVEDEIHRCRTRIKELAQQVSGSTLTA